MIRSTIRNSRLIGLRPSSSSSSSASASSTPPPSSIVPHKLFVVAIPITTHRSYIYCHHDLNVLSLARLNRVPWIMRMDAKAISLASKGWQKISLSSSYINVQITKLVRRLLDTIPYEEHCVALFPSKNAMIRELARDSPDSPSQLTSLLLDASDVKLIPVYYPSSQKQQLITSELDRFARLDLYHQKYAWLCAIGIPLTLPLALIPLVPNVPGIYLAYRLYSHVKAMLGIQHLKYLVGNSHAQSHLRLVPSDSMQLACTFPTTSEETIVLTHETASQICVDFDLPHLKLDLIKAIRQELDRLQLTRT